MPNYTAKTTTPQNETATTLVAWMLLVIFSFATSLCLAPLLSVTLSAFDLNVGYWASVGILTIPPYLANVIRMATR